jgi:hypothetical protein
MIDEDIEYCGGCGRRWEYCNCICSFCPFGGKCKTCKAVHEYSKPTNMPIYIALVSLIKCYLDLGIDLLKLNLNRIKRRFKIFRENDIMKSIRRR